MRILRVAPRVGDPNPSGRAAAATDAMKVEARKSRRRMWLLLRVLTYRRGDYSRWLTSSAPRPWRSARARRLPEQRRKRLLVDVRSVMDLRVPHVLSGAFEQSSRIAQGRSPEETEL